jgi:hypothetical protein
MESLDIKSVLENNLLIEKFLIILFTTLTVINTTAKITYCQECFTI